MCFFLARDDTNTSSHDTECSNDKQPEGEDASRKGVNFLTGESVETESDNNQFDKFDSETYLKACDYIKSKGSDAGKIKLPNPLSESEKLPAPNLDTKLKSTLNTKGEKDSVFVTSYHKDEQAKLSVLEKHVKVTSLPTGKQINGMYKHLEYFLCMNIYEVYLRCK